MGVKGLFPFLKSRVPQCIQSVDIKFLTNKTIAIDGTLLLYKEYTSPWLPVSQSKKHVLWAIRLLRLCREHQIRPIVVFDSPKTTPAKVKERAKRTLKRTRDQQALQNTRDRATRLQGLVETMQSIGALTDMQKTAVLAQFDSGRRADTALHDNDATTLPSVLHPTDTHDPVPSLPGNKEIIDDQVQRDLSDEPRSAAETAALAKRLIEHLRKVLASPSHDAAAELALLMRLMDPGSGLPISEVQELQASTSDLINRLSRRVTFPKYAEILEASKCLQRFEIPVQISPDHFEGECTASYFARAGYADYVATEDSDVLVYGVSQLRGFMSVHGLHENAKTTLSDMRLVDSAIMRNGIPAKSEPWTESTFLDFAILCGTDFTTRIAQLGTTKAAQLMDGYRELNTGLEKVRAELSKGGVKKGKTRYLVHDSFEQDAIIAREVFTSYPKDHKQLHRRLRSVLNMNQAFKKFTALCRDTEKWKRLEKKVMTAAKLKGDDLAILDSPDLYKHAKRLSSGYKSFGKLTSLNDDPERLAADDSGLKLVLQSTT